MHKRNRELIVEPSPKAQWTPPEVGKFVAGAAENGPADFRSDGSGTFS